MKSYPIKSTLIVLFSLFSFNIFGQRTLAQKPIVQSAKVSKTKKGNSKYSATTMLFLEKESSALKKNNIRLINTVLILNDGCSTNDIKELPIQINTGNKTFITALIPTNKFEEVSKNRCIKKMDSGAPFQSTMDEAKELTGVNLLHQGTGLNSSYDGTGVIVGIIDEGFDFTHPAFRDSRGNSRISKVWIQGDNTGTNPNGYNYGSEYTGSNQILSKQYDYIDKSHGTHVAGIAVGSRIDEGLDGLKGVAYNSEVVLVSYFIPESQQFTNTNNNVIDALNYLVNYAKSVNKPLVINMSFGTHFGSHDGWSLLDQEIDNLVEKGIIIVGAAANERGKKIHLQSDFEDESSDYYFIDTNEQQIVFVDAWGQENSEFEINFGVYNMNNNRWVDISSTYVSTSNNANNVTEVLEDSADNDKWTINYQVTEEANQKPRILFAVDYSKDINQSDGDIFHFELKAQNTTIHAWCTSQNYLSEFSDFEYSNVKDGDDDITIREIGGTANRIISVGAFTSKNNYTDFSGQSHDIPAYGVLGEIASFSSKGPTVDSRIKPDITAPGNVIVSAVSSFDTNFNELSASVVSGASDGTKNWWYATMEGTSMASPVVTGIIALWLQANPNLTIDDVKFLLQNASIQDGFTGNSANNSWGWGKINGWLGTYVIEQTLSVAQNHVKSRVLLYPNPTSGITQIVSEQKISDIVLYNSLGQKIKRPEMKITTRGIQLDLSELKTGIYFIHVKNGTKSEKFKILKN